MSAQSLRNIDHENIKTVAMESKDFLKNRKYQYLSTLWIALGIDDVVSEELRYPPIAMMVTWRDNHPDSLLWRSDVIKIAGKTKTHNEVMSQLNYQREVDIDGTNLIMMAASERALSLGYSKLVAKISAKQRQIAVSKLFRRQSASSQSSAPRNPPMQSNEELIHIVREAVEAAIQARQEALPIMRLPVSALLCCASSLLTIPLFASSKNFASLYYAFSFSFISSVLFQGSCALFQGTER